MSDFETLPIGTRERLERLERAAQQALEALQWHYRQGHSNTLGGFRLKIDEKALRELSAALAQQAEPLNLSDPAVQKRLATQWGYVPAAQAEPVEPVAWLAPDGSVRETPAAKSFGEWVWGPDDFEPLYTAPPRCPNCASLESQHAELDDMLVAMKHAVAQAAAVERKACADICDAHASCEGIAERCAADIRARGQA